MDSIDPAAMDFAQLRNDFTRFMMSYKFGIDELMTKITILKEEFTHIHRYSPIEHVSSRLKTPESIVTKAGRKNCPLTLDDIRTNIVDIAGIRITCSFISDTYRIADMLSSQSDVKVLEVKDYIANPKPNGYKSLHVIVEIPVFMSDRVQPVPVELQIRTIAMDFWASLEHKIFYKYDGTIPAPLLTELTEAATKANELDVTMERLHDEVAEFKSDQGDDAIHLDSMPPLALPRELLMTIMNGSREA
ncbi:GTP pyrophosphokinase family protein [Rhodococcus sp. G-MC3]|uniref:GTP pyrophosphokinase n=1 Tax=Rhodococcus sp. G-MC3 TaxID=3046209 RepID=UPI0024BA3712|nr:GTP pyrophosphokinase family protein [Rhodococcus sp. G-MC3]MDJ0393734.1 GTP pyrophosphokinase family protein [Rhodococcus sp. G-MC3]